MKKALPPAEFRFRRKLFHQFKKAVISWIKSDFSWPHRRFNNSGRLIQFHDPSWGQIKMRGGE